MKKLLKNVIKAGVTMCVVGAVLGFAAPAAAALLGPGLLGTAAYTALAATEPMYCAVLFGVFGMISAAVTPAVNYMFGERADKTVTAKTLGVRTRSLGYEQAPDLAHTASAPMHDPSAAASMSASAASPSSAHFQTMVTASKVAAAMKPPGIGIG